MREIDASNANDYLLETGRMQTSATVRELSGGVSNIVLSVDGPHGRFVLKQSRPQLRTKDPWFSGVERIFREMDAIAALRPLLGDAVPAVLFEDRDNYLFAMTAAPEDSNTWKQRLLSGRVETERATRAGRMLAAIHQAGFNNQDWRRRFGDARNFYELRLEPYYIRLRNRFPLFATPIDRLIDDAQNRRTTLVHADFSPKNMLVSESSSAFADGRFMLVDYETVHYGDPAFDLGFFLAHLTLKTIVYRERFNDYCALIDQFWQAYLDGVAFAAADDLVRDGLGHLAANLLVRIDGTSPVEYLDDPARQIGRAYAAELFETAPESPATALEMLRSAAS